MTINVPQGAWRDGEFCFPIRVYYEDTDLGGMVYHGRYISFFERIRSESVRGTPVSVETFLENDGGNDPLIYVVHSINVTYHKQARADDLLMGYSRVTRTRAAAIEVSQRLERDGELVATAELIVALVDGTGALRRWPKWAKQEWLNREQDYKNAVERVSL